MFETYTKIDRPFAEAMRYGGYTKEFRQKVAAKRQAEADAAKRREEAARRREEIRAEAEAREDSARNRVQIGLQASVFDDGRAIGILRMRCVPTWVCRIIDDVAASRNIRLLEMVSPCRSKNVVSARNEAIYRVKEAKPVLSLPQIARWFGRDHTSIAHSLASHAASAGARPLTRYDLANVKKRNANRRKEVR